MLSPNEAVEQLTALHQASVAALHDALERYLATGAVPDPSERARFCYPELRVSYRTGDPPPRLQRAYARFERPGVYATTITEPAFFRDRLLESLRPLVRDYGATIEVGPSNQEIPYSYVVKSGDELAQSRFSAADLARHFPSPRLLDVGDEVADGLWTEVADHPLPLSLFDAVRTDYSLRRLVHYTGTDWREFQSWILLTNYHRYVDQFVQWGLKRLGEGTGERLVIPGGVAVDRTHASTDASAVLAGSAWHRFQMPAYHLTREGGHGVTLINIGVGPSNAKTMTDHLAVLRPHCWLMVGHCAGLRQSQIIGDYVLAHAYLRRDRILDELVPPAIPIPALAEVQVALQQATATVTGEHGEAVKKRLRTGTVVTYDDRNWELRWSQERPRINLSRAIAADMESGTIAAQGYRFRVPYGTLLCVSDKPLHGEIKLPGAANAFYQQAVSEHLLIGLEALAILRNNQDALHSRKLRSFDEPPFR